MSALIFVALAIAWAVYLIPMALKHHEAGDAARTVDGFSSRLRVLARREPVDRRTARLVVPGQPAPVAEVSTALTASSSSPAAPAAPAPVMVPAVPVPSATRRAAVQRATRRRQRVLAVLAALLIVVSVVVVAGLVPSFVLAVPVVLLAAWLVTCRLMVRQERAVPAERRTSASSGETPAEAAGPVDDAQTGGPATEEIAVVEAEVAADPEQLPVEGGWDPVPVTLPTYVGKEQAARRTVRTIDLESTGVWTSGRTAGDAALAREADAAARQARAGGAAARSTRDAAQRRASGS